MIITKLKGGLGNQMFQYALGRHLATKNKTELKLDISSLGEGTASGDTVRTFGLQNFAIEVQVASPEEINKIKTSSYLAILRRKISNRIFGDQTVRFNPKILSLPNNTYLDGYWQSPLYFDAIRNTLLDEFTPTSALSEYGQNIEIQMKKSDSISIHIRRGDYAKNPKVTKEFGVCGLSYYSRALTKIKERVNNPYFFVFSDDIEWVKENLPLGNNVTFVSDSTLMDFQELYLMSKCKHNIIANSSFSWWGAWLNNNSNKVVVAPTPWFDKSIYDTNLLPDTWIQIPKN